MYQVIALEELVPEGTDYHRTVPSPLEVWLAVALIYLVMTFQRLRMVDSYGEEGEKWCLGAARD